MNKNWYITSSDKKSKNLRRELNEKRFNKKVTIWEKVCISNYELRKINYSLSR